MDYKVAVATGKPIDVCVRNKKGKLIVTLLGSKNYRNEVLDNDTVKTPWAVMFRNVEPKTGVIWVSVEGTLATVNGLAGTRVDPQSSYLLRVDEIESYADRMEEFNEVCNL